MGRVGMAMWAWRHRDQLVDWGLFAGRAVTSTLAGEGRDVQLEARLRAALLRDPATRAAGGLAVSVHDGRAVLRGTATAAARDAAVATARAVVGGDVLDEVRVEGGRRRR